MSWDEIIKRVEADDSAWPLGGCSDPFPNQPPPSTLTTPNMTGQQEPI
jgi:hypothetical protein